jgi:SAM-dependent methyltransferase
MKLKMCAEIEGLDSSEASLQIAREKAREEGLEGISYRRGDLNNLRLPRRAYDLIIFHQSLHHVSSLERLLSRVGLALAEDGLLALEEWTGPSREEWDGQRLAALRRMFGELPEAWRRWPVLRDPIEHDDPSEAVRSSAILPLVRRLFHVLFERPYGGHVVSILLSQMALDRIPKDELDLAISRWLALEEQDLENNPESSYHTALVARPRTGLDGFASRTSVLFGWPRGGVAREAAAASSPTASGGGAPALSRDTHSQKPWASFNRASGKMKRPMRLHIGCGQQAIAGWINIEN